MTRSLKRTKEVPRAAADYVRQLKLNNFLHLTKIIGGDDSSTIPIYPIQPQWVENLIYIGREIIGVEYLKDKDEDLTDVSKSLFDIQ
jgi:hypothetical protein